MIKKSLLMTELAIGFILYADALIHTRSVNQSLSFLNGHNQNRQFDLSLCLLTLLSQCSSIVAILVQE